MNLLLRLARARFEDHSSQIVHFVEDPVSNAFLNDLENTSKFEVSPLVKDIKRPIGVAAIF